MDTSIELNYEQASLDYGDDMVDYAIKMYIDKHYQELKLSIPNAYDTKEYYTLKDIIHKFKTTSKYMGADGVSDLCAQMQRYLDRNNYALIDELYPILMKSMDLLFTVCQEHQSLNQNKKTTDDVQFITNQPKEYKEQAMVYQEELNEENDEEEDEDISDYDNSNEEDNDCRSFNNDKDNCNPIKDNTEKPKVINSLDKPKVRKYMSFSVKVEQDAKERRRSSIRNNHIQLHYEQAIKRVQAEIIDVLIQSFVNEDYKKIKESLLKANATKNTDELQKTLHILKLKAKYLCAMEFTNDCIQIENCIKENHEDYNKLQEIFPEFIMKMEQLYDEVEQCYKSMKAKKMHDISPSTPNQIRENSYHNRNFYQEMMSQNTKQVKLPTIKPSHHKTYSHNIKLREIDQLNQNNVPLFQNKGLFNIHHPLITTNDNDSEQTFDSDINPYYDIFKQAINDTNKLDLIEGLIKFKELAIKYQFITLIPHIAKWINIIENETDICTLDIEEDDIIKVLNQMKVAIKDKDQEKEKEKGTGDWSNNKSDSPSSSLGGKTEDNILMEMTPLSLSCFFKSENTIDDFETRLEELNTEEKRGKNIFLKDLPKPLKNMNPFVDCNYPFKEEGPSCIII